MKNTPIVSLKNLSSSYWDKILFQNVSCDIVQWDIILLSGPSWVGKTTLLTLIWWIKKPDTWVISYWFDIRLRDQYIWYAFIDGPFFENLSVLENIVFLENFTSIQIDREYLNELCVYFEIDDLMNSSLISLSSWQRERVNLVRAIVHRPRLVILDEPGANLDDRLFQKLYQFIEEHIRAKDITCVMVSHDDRFIKIATKRIEL